MPAIQGTIVTGYAQMWPREVFDIRKGKNRIFQSVRDALGKPGVYVLYRDDHPYYIGKATNSLFNRIWAHANQPKERYYNFWNFFAAFAVTNKSHIDEVEGILIAAMPMAVNSANPRIARIDLPGDVAKKIRALRLAMVNLEAMLHKPQKCQ